MAHSFAVKECKDKNMGYNDTKSLKSDNKPIVNKVFQSLSFSSPDITSKKIN